MSDESRPQPTPPDPGVRFRVFKIVGAAVIGSLIAFQALSEADHIALLGPVWGPRGRILAGIVMGGFYALERYLSRAPQWFKPDA